MKEQEWYHDRMYEMRRELAQEQERLTYCWCSEKSSTPSPYRRGDESICDMQLSPYEGVIVSVIRAWFEHPSCNIL